METIEYRESIKRRNRLFCYILTPLVLLFVVLLVFPSSIPRFTQNLILFEDGRWMLSDFFFTLRSLVDGDPYGNSEIYMPLTYLLLYPFSQLADYASLTVEHDRVYLNECWGIPVGMVSYMFLLLLMSLLFWHSLQKLNRKNYLSNWSIGLLFFSSIFIFSIERGNLIILSAALVNYFFAYYKDSDRRKVFFALFALCIASILKIYPAIFGLLLLKEKRYKDVLWCFAIGLPLVFLPYLAFKGGLNNVPIHLSNIANMQGEFSTKWIHFFGITKFADFLYYSVYITGPTYSILHTVLSLLNQILLLVTIAIVVLSNNAFWKNAMLLSCALILYPTNSGFYCGLYFFPVLCIFMGETNANKTLQYIILILSCIILNPFQVTVLDGFRVASIGSNIALITIWLLLICSSIKDVLNSNISKKCYDAQLEGHYTVS